MYAFKNIRTKPNLDINIEEVYTEHNSEDSIQDDSIQNELLLKMKKAQDFCSATWIRLKSY